MAKSLGQFLFLFALCLNWVRATEISHVADITDSSEKGSHQEDLGNSSESQTNYTISPSQFTNSYISHQLPNSSVSVLVNDTTSLNFSVSSVPPIQEIMSSSTLETLPNDSLPHDDSTTSSAPQPDTQHNMSEDTTLGPTVPVTRSRQNILTESAMIPNKTSESEITTSTGFDDLVTKSYLSVTETFTESVSSGGPVTEFTSIAMNGQSTTSTEGLVPSSDPSSHIPSETRSSAINADVHSSSSFPLTSEAFLSTQSTDVVDGSSISFRPEPESATADSSSILLSTETTLHTSSFVLQFTGNTRNCTIEKQYSDLEKQVRHILLDKAGVPTHKLSLNVVNCSQSYFMSVGVSKDYESSVSQYLKQLEVNSTKFKINDEFYHLNILTTANPGNSDAHRQPPQVALSSRHTDIEFVIYVALGSACAFLLTLAVVLVTCKYCRTKPYKSFDLNDVSHLNHRLEDYSLRQIPRPKSVYVDYCRRLPAGSDHYSPLEEQASNGMVHAFDTSVVPLEDVPMKLTEDDTPSPPRAEESQTHGIKAASAVNHEYEEIDMKTVNSTENLHNIQQPSIKLEASHWGVDNDSFTT